MTISANRRTDDVRAAVSKLTELVGDDHRIVNHFSPDDPRFSDFLETTWRELLDADLIEWRNRSLVLTGRGWTTGLRLCGRLQSTEVRHRAQTIVEALKARVKGRHGLHDECVDVRNLARELGLPVGWLWNAMDADLLQKVFPKDRMNARLDQQHKLLIKIPSTFGSDPIEIE
jgi:hypothetical protein